MLDFNILTFQDSMNYGALLQAYALQCFIEEMSYSVGMFEYNRPNDVNVNNTFRAKISNLLNKYLADKEANEKRINRFESFRRDYFNLNRSTDCKAFISGSDQVWNLGTNLDPTFFLQFLDNSVIKASYAASMSKDCIPDERKELIKTYLNTFDSISVREESVKECLEQICEKPINVNIDPTLLHDKDKYLNIARKIDGLPEKYILAYILHIPQNGNALLRWLKNETGLPVVLIESTGSVGYVVHNDLVIKDAGPEEFLYLFSKAECVVTTSFHGTCFSLIFEKEFYSIVNPNSPGRISNILNLVGLTPVVETDRNFIRNNVDWHRIKEVISAERIKSEQYFRRLIELTNEKKIQKNNETIKQMSDRCTGCGACGEICPTSAISMSLDERGFYVPYIDEQKCVHCGKCNNICPLNSKTVVWPVKSYYGWNKSPQIVFDSSSGGAFYSLADSIIKNGGDVLGAIYSEDWKDIYFELASKVGLKKMQKSKYVVSSPVGIYDKIKTSLEQGKKVLFVGAPCQCAGVRNVFGTDCDELYICDFVCGGMPSLTLYREHLEYLGLKYNSEISDLDFRPKNWGWGKHRIYVRFENGKKYVRRNFADSYFKCFIDKTSVRNVCHECPYYHFHRSDITIADFWGYKVAGVKKNKNGMSMVVCNTDKGTSLFDVLADFEKKDLPIEFTQYTIREKIPDISKLEKADRLFALTKEKGFESAAADMYELNVIKYYMWRIGYIFHK